METEAQEIKTSPGLLALPVPIGFLCGLVIGLAFRVYHYLMDTYGLFEILGAGLMMNLAIEPDQTKEVVMSIFFISISAVIGSMVGAVCGHTLGLPRKGVLLVTSMIMVIIHLASGQVQIVVS